MAKFCWNSYKLLIKPCNYCLPVTAIEFKFSWSCVQICIVLTTLFMVRKLMIYVGCCPKEYPCYNYVRVIGIFGNLYFHVLSVDQTCIADGELEII